MIRRSVWITGIPILLAVILLIAVIATDEIRTALTLSSAIVLLALWAVGQQGRVTKELQSFEQQAEEMSASRSLLEGTNRMQRAILDGTYFGIIAVDEEGLIREFNTGAEQMLGYSREELIGRETPMLFHLESEIEARAAELSRQCGRTIEPGVEVFTFQVGNGGLDDQEWTFVRKDGTRLPVTLTVTARHGDDGEILGFMGVVRDVSVRKSTERALRMSEERTRLFAEYAPAAVAMFDRQMRYLVVSRKWLADYSLHGEVIGRSHYEVFPEIGPTWKALHQRALAGEVLTSEADLFIRDAGDRQWLSWEIRPWFGIDGEIGGMVMLTQDITERQLAAAALQESEERFRQAFEFAGIGMAIVGLDGRWNRLNKAVCDILGYTSEDLVKKTFQDITHPDDLDADLSYVRALLAGELGFYQMEKRYFQQDGHIVWVRLTASLVRSSAGDPLHFIAHLENVTARKQLEHNLAHARDEAVAASRLKSEFLANMSHEIRTPMNGIMGMAGLLAETPLTPDQREMTAVIQSSSESLLDIINDILDFSKIEAGQLRIHPVEFHPREMIGDVLRLLAVKAHEKGIELLDDFDPRLDRAFWGDSGRLRQVMVNLVGNAIKFTPGGEVRVRFTEIADEGDFTTMRCEVIDNGIGIAPAAQAMLFKPFSQADGSITRRYGGSGLGLAISRHLIELMGGFIHCESVPGAGSRFWFEVSLMRREMRLGELSPEVPGGRRVLLVDDNASNRRILIAQLAGFGIPSTAVEDPREVVALLLDAAAKGSPYELALIDWDMPHLSGLELAAAIREEEGLAELPLVMLSSAGTLPLTGEGMAAVQFAAFLTKPVRLEQLRRCLAMVFSRQQQDPAALPAPVAAAEEEEERPAGGGFHLLLAEDSVVNQKVACRLLAKLGHTVEVAENGERVLARLAEGARYDAVLMDCQMPVMDGYSATRRIRNGEVAGVPQDIPIIALTANAMVEDRLRCLECGMTDYISKPVRAEDIQQALLRCLAKAT